jgi:hypothetical protein
MIKYLRTYFLALTAGPREHYDLNLAKSIDPQKNTDVRVPNNVFTTDSTAAGGDTIEAHSGLSSQDNLSVNISTSAEIARTQSNQDCLLHRASEPRRVPRTDMYIYRDAEIGKEFLARFDVLVDLFKQAVENHPTLKSHTKDVAYHIYMCGSTQQDAIPSIIVLCTKAIFKDLRLLLNSRHIKRQYSQQEHSGRKNLLSFVNTGLRNRTEVSSRPPFRLIFWQEPTTPIKRNFTSDPIHAHGRSVITMCGSLVRVEDRRSTLGVLVSVDSKLYGMTVDHLFRKESYDEESTCPKYSGTLALRGESEETEEETKSSEEFWFDDVVYGVCEDDDESFNILKMSEVKEVQAGVLDEHEMWMETGHRVNLAQRKDASSPYLDWALIDFDNRSSERPNAFYSEENPEHPIFFTNVASLDQVNDVAVLMISGASGTRKGVLLHGHSYLGGKPGQSLSRVWNVLLSDSKGEFEYIRTTLPLADHVLRYC